MLFRRVSLFIALASTAGIAVAAPSKTTGAKSASTSSKSDAGVPAAEPVSVAASELDGGLVTAAPATGTPAPAAVVAPAGLTAAPGVDGATYAVRLKDIEVRIDELKDQIRRTHTKLSLLSDAVLSAGSTGARAEVVLKNEMSSAFKLVRALFVIDGAVQYNKSDDTGALAEQKEIPIYNGSVPPGDHTVQVVLAFQGNGYGVFTYFRNYKFEVKSSHAFTSVDGKQLVLTATAVERGGVTTPVEQRPGVEWGEKVSPYVQGIQPAAAAGGGAK